MPIIEVVSLTLGPIIAKAILAKWVGGKSLIFDVASSIVDRIAESIPDRLAQDRGRKQLERIADEVCDDIASLFTCDDTEATDDSAIPIVQAVADTLAMCKLSASDLVDFDLDNEKILADLHRNRPGALFFDAQEETYYQRILLELSNRIVSIAASLPNFHEAVSASLLQSNSGLYDLALMQLSELRQIREAITASNPDRSDANFESGYRAAVIHRFDKLQLFGAEVSQACKQHRLTVAYITLALEHSKIGHNTDGRMRLESSNEEGADELNPGVVAADRLLQLSNRLLISGKAGSGKTTLLQWIAVQTARADITGDIDDWMRSFPFFIKLREFVDKELPAPADFVSLVSQAHSGLCPDDWVNEKLQLGTAVVLIDGVDEIPSDRRNEVKEWLQDLIIAFPEAHYILTSRPEAVVEGWLDDTEFTTAELLPMGLSDIDVFVHQWHKAVADRELDQEAINELPGLEHALSRLLRQTPSLRSLASTPLLCAMICAIHRDRNHQLPSDRIELYNICCTMLIQRRDIERHISLPDAPNLHYRHKRALIEDIAYFLVTNNRSQAPYEQVLNRLALRLKGIPKIDETLPADDVLRFLLERTGLLRVPAPGTIDFAHRTFQEYLAACKLAVEGDVGQVVGNAHRDSWSETVILSAGCGSGEFSANLLIGLVERGNKEFARRHKLQLMAIACLETSVDVPPDVQRLVKDQLSKLVPPQYLTEAPSVASAGDLAVPYLSNGWQEKARPAAACVRALSLIGSEAALDALTQFADDRRITVQREVLAAWQYFDQGDYARRVLAKAEHWLHRIDKPRVATFDGYEALSFLKHLFVKDCGNAQNLDPVGHISSLLTLQLMRSNIIENITPIGNLGNLRSLYLSNIDALSDLSPLSQLGYLEYINILNCDNITDISPLGPINTITEVILYSMKLGSVEPLAQLAKLESLTLNYLDSLDPKPISKIASLKYAHLSRCQDENLLEYLAELEALEAIYLSACNLGLNGDKLPLLKNVSAIWIGSKPKLTSLEHVAQMPKLQRLGLIQCDDVKSLNELRECDTLEEIDLLMCQSITDLTPLEHIPNLKTIRVSLGSDKYTITESLKAKIEYRGQHFIYRPRS